MRASSANTRKSKISGHIETAFSSAVPVKRLNQFFYLSFCVSLTSGEGAFFTVQRVSACRVFCCQWLIQVLVWTVITLWQMSLKNNGVRFSLSFFCYYWCCLSGSTGKFIGIALNQWDVQIQICFSDRHSVWNQKEQLVRLPFYYPSRYPSSYIESLWQMTLGFVLLNQSSFVFVFHITDLYWSLLAACWWAQRQPSRWTPNTACVIHNWA